MKENEWVFSPFAMRLKMRLRRKVTNVVPRSVLPSGVHANEFMELNKAAYTRPAQVSSITPDSEIALFGISEAQTHFQIRF
jgi:hypothetical protein